MSHYGITPQDLKFCQSKIDKQKDYLSSNSYLTSSGQLKSFLDISMSANISDRYYAQLTNKVNTFQQIMLSSDLVPIFMTSTLDGVYHDLLKGDYSRFTLEHQKKLPENSKNGYLQTRASERKRFSPKHLYQLLRFQFNSFRDTRFYKDLNKKNDLAYLCATEPHKSGVPHMHILMYVPQSAIDKLKDIYISKFWASQGQKQSKKRLTRYQIKNGEINGFQWTITNAVGYIMKYCTKSFMNLKNQEELDELQAWYIKHRITRISMSHTLVPQWVYQKIYPLESDWNYLTDLKINSTCEWSKSNNFFEFTDKYKNRVLRFDNGLYQIIQDDEVIQEFGEKRETLSNIVTINNIDFQPLSYRFAKYDNLFTVQFLSKHVKKAFATLDFNKKYPNGKLQQKKHVKRLNKDNIKIVENGIKRPFYKKQPYEMSHIELYRYYQSLDIMKTDPLHLIVVQNELIDRGLLRGKKQSLNIDDIFDTPKSSPLLYTKVAIQHHNAYQAVQTVLNSPCKTFKYDLFTKDFHANYKRRYFLGLKKTKKEVIEVIPNKYPTLFDVA